MGQLIRESIEGVIFYRRRPRKYNVYRDVGRVQDGSKRKNRRERLALRNKVNEEKHLKMCGELREDLTMKRYLHGPMDYGKRLKLRFGVRNLDLPEGRKRYTMVQ